MSFYIRANIIGRYEHFRFAQWIEQSGIGEAEYFQGGWCDFSIDHIAPHIKFEREEDAMAYVLTHGGEYSKSMPLK